jgi:cytochrome c
MSMKRCFGLSHSPSVSLLSRIILVGSALGFATACAHRDAGKTDSTTVTSASSATTSTSTVAAAQPSTPVESVSTGETTISAESKSNPAVAATAVTTGAAKVSAKPTAPAASSTTHKVHSVAPNASTTTPATTPAVAPAAPATAAKPTASDTGEKAPAADTSKKTATAAGGADHLLVSPQEYEGWKMFSVYCYRCHGVDAMGGGIAPNLRHSVGPEGSVTHDIFITTVTYGRTALGMPTWKALLSPEQMEDLWLYINARSTNRLYPGRPHMAAGANP